MKRRNRFWQDLLAIPAHFDIDLHVKLLSVAWNALSISATQSAPRKPWMSDHTWSYGVYFSVGKEATS